MGKVIAVASGKGGTGKTVFSSNIGAVLAEQGSRVVLIDMDLGLRNLDLALGLENSVVYDVADVMTGTCRIKQALIRDDKLPDLYMLAAPQFNKENEVTPLHMKVLCDKLRRQFDYVIVDCPAGVDDGLRIAVEGADMAVIVITPDAASMRDGDKVNSVLKKFGVRNRAYILNMVREDLIASGFSPGITELILELKAPLAGIVVYDDNIHIAAGRGIPIVLKKDTYIYDNFCRIADRLR